MNSFVPNSSCAFRRRPEMRYAADPSARRSPRRDHRELYARQCATLSPSTLFRFIKTAVFAVLLTGPIVTEAGAVTIDFNDTAPEGASTAFPFGYPYVEDGFHLRNGTMTRAYTLFDANYAYTRRRESDYLAWRGGGAKVILESASLTPFSIQSFVYGNLASYGPGGTFTITGNFSGGGTILANVTPRHDVQTYFFDSSWTNLSSVVFASADVDSMMDTIVVNEPAIVVNEPVPEGSSTIAMLGFVLMAVAGVRRKFGI